jgi:hypothetical protein
LRKRQAALREREQRAANEPSGSSRPSPYWLEATQDAMIRAVDGISLDLRERPRPAPFMAPSSSPSPPPPAPG